MSTQTLTIQYQAAEIDRITDPYWIRIEPVDQEPETATVSQAANLLDALYQIDPCTEGEDQGQLVEQEDYAPTVASAIDLSYCDQEYDGSVEMDIRIIRSHLAEPYRLQLQGGELIQTIQVSEQVTRSLAISGQTTLDYPVVSGFSCSPAPLKRVGNTLLFEPALDGHTLRATYLTRYALATVKVLGVEGQPGECRALAFHHGLVADETLTPPETEQVDRSLCPSTSYESPERDDEVTCYQEVVVHRVCSCSKHEAETLRYEEIVPCPGEMHCANNETRCMHLVGTVSVTEWIGCGDEDRSGDFDGDVHDPNFYTEQCCAGPAMGLPRCVTEHATYRGGLNIIHGAAHYRSLYGDLTRIVPVSPLGGICGEHVIEQRIMGNNCCDGVDRLAWNHEVTPATIAPGGSILIGVTGGGKFAYEWRVAGTGFHFGGGDRRKVTSLPSVALFADATACGSATITCADGCSATAGYIRATAGQWVQVESAAGGLPACALMGDCSSDYVGGGWYEAISGRYKLQQFYSNSVGSPGAHATEEAAYAACMSAYSAALAEVQELWCSQGDCIFCFSATGYAPCAQVETGGAVDPRAAAACNQAAYGYIWHDGWWWANAYHRHVGYTILSEWSC